MEFSEFKLIPPGEIFRVVTTRHHTHERVKGVYPELTFVCKKGYGHNDWAIYCHYPERGVQWISENGDKVAGKADILSLLPCDQETFDHYRY